MKPSRLHQASLRARLWLVGGLGLVLITLLATVMLGQLFERAARQSLDARLTQDLIGLVAQVETDPQGRPVLRQEPNDARFQRVFSGAYWQLAQPDGRVLYQSRSLWDDALPAPTQGLGRAVAARDAAGPLDQPLRVLSQQIRLPRARTPIVATVAADRSDLQQQVAAFRRHSAVALTLLVAAWLAVLASQVRFGLRPLKRLGTQVEQVRRGQAQRLDTSGLGVDIAPLGEELNGLLDHHQRMVARARTSAQDLAHALKTPLSVLAAEADGDGGNWRQTLREQGARMQASVERYLAAGLAVDHRQRVAVAPVAQALCRLMARVHGARGVRFEADAMDPALTCTGDAADLEEMLGNLLDNAGRWAAQQVQVSARQADGCVLIEVRDDGPGLAPSQLEAVLARGVRLDERESSSGLGLAIAGDIAASHGGALVLENAGPGLRATLRLPAG